MASKASLYLDSYGRQARLAPGLMVLLPVSITITALGLKALPPISILAGLLTAAGGPALLADTVRERGLKAQEQLYKKWGAAPTTLALRTRTAGGNLTERSKWRAAVEKVVGVDLASARSEAQNPNSADQRIESAVADLRDMFRDEKKYPLLAAELRNYGYRRNMYGSRWLGRLVALAGVLAIGLPLGLSHSYQQHPAALIAGLAINASMFMLWWLLPTPEWVRSMADKYGFQLMQAAVSKAR